MLKSKIQEVKITETLLNCPGSIGIDEDLMKAANIIENEQVHVLNLDNGERFETYAIKEESGSGKICIYGPAARKGKVGDTLYILAYCIADDEKADKITPAIIKAGEDNKIKQTGLR